MSVPLRAGFLRASRSEAVDRRRRPSLERCEDRQLLSSGLPVPANPPPEVQSGAAATAGAPSVPVAASAAFAPVRMPILRAEAGQPFNGVVATFVSNTELDPGRLVATIEWDDGTSSPATLSANPWGGLDASGTHTFAAQERGLRTIHIEVRDAATQAWLFGQDQRLWIGRPRLQTQTQTQTPSAFATPSSGDPLDVRPEPSQRRAPGRLRFEGRRQEFRGALDHFRAGTATPSERQLLRRVHAWMEQQNKGFFDDFVDGLPFT